MTTREEAAEQLRVIRAMMERATIFRALSGETALFGGAVSLAMAWASEKRHGWAWASWWVNGSRLMAIAFVGALGLWRTDCHHQQAREGRA